MPKQSNKNLSATKVAKGSKKQKKPGDKISKKLEKTYVKNIKQIFKDNKQDENIRQEIKEVLDEYSENNNIDELILRLQIFSGETLSENLQNIFVKILGLRNLNNEELIKFLNSYLEQEYDLKKYWEFYLDDNSKRKDDDTIRKKLEEYQEQDEDEEFERQEKEKDKIYRKKLKEQYEKEKKKIEMNLKLILKLIVMMKYL